MTLAPASSFGRLIDRSGHVLVLVSSLALWWGIFNVADGVLAVQRPASPMTAVHPDSAFAQEGDSSPGRVRSIPADACLPSDCA